MTQNELPKPQKNELQNQIVKRGTNLSTTTQAFISSFYKGANYTIGAQIKTTDNSVDYLVSEIIINDEAKARGYILTDITGKNPTYFTDVDRSTYKMTVVNISNNTTTIISDIDKTSDYASTNEFDIIKVVEQNNDIDIVERRPFIGNRVECGSCVMGERLCYMVGYFFWIRVTKTEIDSVIC